MFVINIGAGRRHTPHGLNICLAPADALADLGGGGDLVGNVLGDDRASNGDGAAADEGNRVEGTEAGDVADGGGELVDLAAAEGADFANEKANDLGANGALDLIPRAGGGAVLDGEHRELVIGEADEVAGLEGVEQREERLLLLRSEGHILIELALAVEVNGALEGRRGLDIGLSRHEGTEVEVEGAKVEVKGGLAGELDGLGLVARHGERAGGEGRDEGNGSEELLHGFGWNVMMCRVWRCGRVQGMSREIHL